MKQKIQLLEYRIPWMYKFQIPIDDKIEMIVCTLFFRRTNYQNKL